MKASIFVHRLFSMHKETFAGAPSWAHITHTYSHYYHDTFSKSTVACLLSSYYPCGYFILFIISFTLYVFNVSRDCGFEFPLGINNVFICLSWQGDVALMPRWRALFPLSHLTSPPLPSPPPPESLNLDSSLIMNSSDLPLLSRWDPHRAAPSLRLEDAPKGPPETKQTESAGPWRGPRLRSFRATVLSFCVKLSWTELWP